MHLFEHARTGEVAIQNNRFVSLFTQWVPVSLLKIGAPVYFVQVAYSLIFPIYYSLVAWIVWSRLKVRALVVGWCLLWLGFAMHTHFWIQSELPQSLAILLLSLAVTIYNIRVGKLTWKWFIPIQLILTITFIFGHPLLVIPALSLNVLLLLLRNGKGKRLIYISLVMIILVFTVRSIYFNTSYDSGMLSKFDATVDLIFSGTIPYSVTRLCENFISIYWPFTVSFLVVISMMLYKRKFFAALVLLVSVVSYFIFVAYSFPSDYTRDFYIENLYLPAAFITFSVGSIFVSRNVLEAFWKLNFVRLSLILACAIRVIQITYLGQSTYSSRFSELEHLLNTYANEKVIMKENADLTSKLIMTWGTPYEAWLLSAQKGQDTQCFSVHPYLSKVKSRLNSDTLFIASFHVVPFEELPDEYFSNPGGAYHLVEEID